MTTAIATGKNMLENVQLNHSYRNIKTQKIYTVLLIGKHSETQELMVVYQRFDEIWVRPLDLFREKFEDHRES